MGLLYFAFSFLLTFVAMPAVIRLAEWKQLFDLPDGRKVHRDHISALGGIAMFGTMLVSSFTFLDMAHFTEFRNFLAAYVLIFLLGVLDDLRQASYWLKLIVQVSAALVLVIPGELCFTSFQGLFSVFEISHTLGSIFTVAFIILVINAFNFIDGIDGLAGMLGFLILTFFALWFYSAGFDSWKAMSVFMAGSLLAFLAYNRPPARIFMGDSGSLSTGFVIAGAAIAFIEGNIRPDVPLRLMSAPAVAFSVMAIPLFDTLRLILLRIIRGRSPFSPDQAHIHHILLRRGWSHHAVLVLLGGYTLLLVALNLYLDLKGLGVNYLMALDFVLTGLFYGLLVLRKDRSPSAT